MSSFPTHYPLPTIHYPLIQLTDSRRCRIPRAVRCVVGDSPGKACPVSEHFQKPLKADEIEALLRSARETESDRRSDVLSNEPLGPGDVQHLRNTALHDDFSTNAGWPYDAVSADELLHRAEQHLAAAMSPDTDFSRHESRPAQPHSFPPLATATGTTAIGLAAAGSSASFNAGLPLSVIGDIELDVTLELGRAELMIEELLALREGSVVTLNKEAGEPIDILANGKLVARGEVIVVDDKFCVRICEVIGQVPRDCGSVAPPTGRPAGGAAGPQ